MLKIRSQICADDKFVQGVLSGKLLPGTLRAFWEATRNNKTKPEVLAELSRLCRFRVPNNFDGTNVLDDQITASVLTRKKKRKYSKGRSKGLIAATAKVLIHEGYPEYKDLRKAFVSCYEKKLPAEGQKKSDRKITRSMHGFTVEGRKATTPRKRAPTQTPEELSEAINSLMARPRYSLEQLFSLQFGPWKPFLALLHQKGVSSCHETVRDFFMFNRIAYSDYRTRGLLTRKSQESIRVFAEIFIPDAVTGYNKLRESFFDKYDRLLRNSPSAGGAKGWSLGAGNRQPEAQP